MAISKTSGALALSEIQTEFGGSNPIGMSEYYGDGDNVPDGAADGDGNAIPESGAISVSQFYDTANVSFTAASGGTVTNDGNFKVHIFNTSGTFTISSVNNQSQDATFLVIAGGAGGGGLAGGGGGGGGYLEGTLSQAVGDYAVTVGAAGALGQGEGTGGRGGNGGNSVLDGNSQTTTATGGGAVSYTHLTLPTKRIV